MDDLTAESLAKEVEDLCYAEMQVELRRARRLGRDEGVIWGMVIGGLLCGVGMPLLLLLIEEVLS